MQFLICGATSFVDKNLILIDQNWDLFFFRVSRTVSNCNSMPAIKFSTQKGAQRQRTLGLFANVMKASGNDLSGLINKTRLGKQLRSQILQVDEKHEKLVELLGKMYCKMPNNTKQQWLAIVKTCGFKRSELLKSAWNISPTTWSRVTVSEGTIPTCCPFVPSSQQSAPTTSLSPNPQTKSKNWKEHRNSGLLPYLHNMFDKLSFPCPHTTKRTLSYSVNRLHQIYSSQENKPCPISRSCFQRIWKQHFKKHFSKPGKRDGLCQLCEIGHKLERLEEMHQQQHLPLTPEEKKTFQQKKPLLQDTKSATNKSKTYSKATKKNFLQNKEF